MRILHVVPTYVPAWRYGGPVRSVHGLARAQAAAGDEVVVYTTNADGERRLDVPLDRPVELDGHLVRYFPTSAPHRLGRSRAMARALAQDVGSFSLVHLHSVFLWPTWAAARAARHASRPYLISPRGMLVGDLIRERGALRKRLWIQWVERHTLAGAAAIVATSTLEERELSDLGLALAPVVIAPNGIDLEEWSLAGAQAASSDLLRRISGEPYLLYLGRLSWKKGLDHLVRAVAVTREVRLLVAGVDDERLRPALERLARELGVAARVEFLGAVSGADRVALLRGARACALLSTSENFGNAVLESMACAVPVVVSRGVGLAEEVERSGCGLVVEASPEAAAEALHDLWENPQRAREMGAQGERRVAEGYSWRAIASRMREIYREAGAV